MAQHDYKGCKVNYVTMALYSYWHWASLCQFQSIVA